MLHKIKLTPSADKLIFSSHLYADGNTRNDDSGFVFHPHFAQNMFLNMPTSLFTIKVSGYSLENKSLNKTGCTNIRL